jgi:hypothetical protein
MEIAGLACSWLERHHRGWDRGLDGGVGHEPADIRTTTTVRPAETIRVGVARPEQTTQTAAVKRPRAHQPAATSRHDQAYGGDQQGLL